MPIPKYIQFLQWAEARKDPFTFLDVELFLNSPRETAVQLVLLAPKNRRVERLDEARYRFIERGFPGSAES
jgi:hypothetical protein